MQKDIGLRLREERERLGLSQLAMGDIGGIKKLTQLYYEQGKRCPDAMYLLLLSRFGLDVQFVVTGIRSETTLTKEELELLEKYREAPIPVKFAVIGALTSNPTVSKNTTDITVTGNHNKTAGHIYNE